MFSLAIFTDTTTATGASTRARSTSPHRRPPPSPSPRWSPATRVTQALTIANAGTAALRYAVTVAASTTLGDTLTLEVRTLGTSCAAFDGTAVLAATALDGATVGSPAQGSHAGDRTLAAAASEVLCFRVALPARHGQRAPGPVVGRDVHLRRRADRQQPVIRFQAAPRTAARRGPRSGHRSRRPAGDPQRGSPPWASIPCRSARPPPGRRRPDRPDRRRPRRPSPWAGSSQRSATRSTSWPDRRWCRACQSAARSCSTWSSPRSLAVGDVVTLETDPVAPSSPTASSASSTARGGLDRDEGRCQPTARPDPHPRVGRHRPGRDRVAVRRLPDRAPVHPDGRHVRPLDRRAPAGARLVARVDRARWTSAAAPAASRRAGTRRRGCRAPCAGRDGEVSRSARDADRPPARYRVRQADAGPGRAASAHPRHGPGSRAGRRTRSRRVRSIGGGRP